MIVGDIKPLAEIVSAIKEYKQVLVLGCGSCVTVCLSGGEREAEQLCHELSQIRHYQETPPKFKVGSILRQCERDLVIEYQDIPDGTDAVLSLACGAGVQTLADALFLRSIPPFWERRINPANGLKNAKAAVTVFLSIPVVSVRLRGVPRAFLTVRAAAPKGAFVKSAAVDPVPGPRSLPGSSGWTNWTIMRKSTPPKIGHKAAPQARASV
jgi:hypothetical protein